MAFTLRKRGKHWHFRATVPFRQADGRITKDRVEESTGEGAKARAARVAQDRIDYYREQAYRPQAKASPSFTDAAITYAETKSPSKRDKGFVAKLVAHFKDTPIAEIDQGAVANAAHTLYPAGSPATHARAVFAPVVTVLRISGVRPDFKRPRISRTAKSVPPDDWFDRVLPSCEPRLAALLIFLTLTGRRITEALEAIDNGDGTATIGRTKTGSPVVVRVPSLCGDLLGGALPGRRLFTYGDRHNVYRALKQACKRAGVPYYGTHALGRHSAARRLLREGHSTKFVAQALGWSSTRMVDYHYGEFARDEVADKLKESQERWSKKRQPDNT